MDPKERQGFVSTSLCKRTGKLHGNKSRRVRAQRGKEKKKASTGGMGGDKVLWGVGGKIPGRSFEIYGRSPGGTGKKKSHLSGGKKRGW